jgi:hypothetical protein
MGRSWLRRLETVSAIGLSTDQGELAFIIIRRSITEALLDLVGKIASQQLIETKNNSDKLVEQLDFSISAREV